MKVKLTENQYKNIQKLITEDSNNRYERKVNVSVGTTGQSEYEGMILDEITMFDTEMRLTYLIEQEHRSWGIKDISLYDIKGYDDIEVTLYLYPHDSNDSDDAITKEIRIPLDWSKLDVDTNQSHGIISVGDTLHITIYVEDGKLVTDMSIDVYTL